MDERDWTDRRLTISETLDLGECTVRLWPHMAATLISGKIAEALEQLAPGAPILDLAERPHDTPFALRIARDQGLLITGEPLSEAEGWHDAGFAVSRADARFQTFHLSGSPSAAIRFAGSFALLSGMENGYLLWVERGSATYLTTFLRTTRALD